MDALCASLLPDEEINQLNFRAGLESGPKVVLILSRGFTQSKSAGWDDSRNLLHAPSFRLHLADWPLCAEHMTFSTIQLCIPVQLGEVRLHIMVFVHVSSRLSHCVSSCFHLFVCVWQCSLSSSPTEQKATYHTGWLAH